MPERAGKLYQNGIETNVAAVELRMFFQKRFGTGTDSPFLYVADGIGGFIQRCSFFDFDEHQHVSAFGNKIDFTRMRSASADVIGRQNPVAFQAKQQSGQKFCPMSGMIVIHF